MAESSAQLSLDPMAEHAEALRGHTLVLYDGICVMCNRTVRVLLANDPAGHLRFTPIEGALGQAMLARHPGLFAGKTREGKPAALSAQSVVVLTDVLTPAEQAHKRSDASIAAMRLLQSPWPLAAAVLHAVPRPLRDLGYRLVAWLRYPVFGKYAVCPRPTESERGRIVGL
jgi:predicted DCC family thiol-disulfide oxidoreductase YuxK